MFERAMIAARQKLCWLITGHCPLFHFEGRRVMTECQDCGLRTEGWEVGSGAAAQ